MRLLIAEDDLDLREVLASIFRDEGATVREAATAEEALAAFDTERFDVVLSDGFTGGGADRLSALRSLVARARPTPVVVMSGWDVEAIAAEVGARHAVPKPFSIDMLVALVASVSAEALPPGDPRVALVDAYLGALGARDWDALAALCTDDVVYTLPGTSRFATAVRGRAAFRAFAEETFRDFPAARFSEAASYPNDHGVAVRYRGTWRAEDGEEKSAAGALILALEGGRIRRIGVEMNDARLEKLAGAFSR